MMSNRILVADDEPSVLKVVKYYAEKNGYRVDTASDGESALRLFQDATPDLVVLDIMMPGLNGFEVCKAIREVDIRVPVIFLTAKGDLVDKGMGFKLGGRRLRDEAFRARRADHEDRDLPTPTRCISSGKKESRRNRFGRSLR